MPDAAFWDELAERYAAKPVDDPDAFERKIAITKSLMAPEHEVADFGCGTGTLVLRLADDGRLVHGLDLSGEMVRIARAKATAAGVENVAFHHGAFDDSVPFGDESLDGVLAYSILHLLEDRQAALRTLFRLCRPGGYFVSSTVCLGVSWVPYGALLTLMKWAGKAPDVWVLTPETLKREIEAAGFVDVQMPDVGAKSTIGFMVARKPA